MPDLTTLRKKKKKKSENISKIENAGHLYLLLFSVSTNFEGENCVCKTEVSNFFIWYKVFHSNFYNLKDRIYDFF